MPPPLLTLSNVKLTFGGDPLLTAANLNVGARSRIALVGRNGSGKSTLLKIAAGFVEPDAGERLIVPSATVGYLEQEPDFSGFKSVAQYIESGVPETIDSGASLITMDALKIKPDADPNLLSGGEARRVALARILSAQPDILLLDEPTNHLDLPTILWLEETIKNSSSAIVVISHDRQFLEATTNATSWVDRGVTRSLNKGFGAFEQWRDDFLEQEKLDQHKLDRKLSAEEDWLRYGVTARRKRNVRRLKALHDLRATRREEKTTHQNISISANEATNSGKRVIVAKNISKSFGDAKIIDDFSIEIVRGDRVGFVGPNGAGKTTLIKTLIGASAPDHGTVDLGTNLETVSLDQRREILDPNARVADAITDGRGDWVTLGNQKKHVASYLNDFLFSPEQWRAPVTALSGGERGRLALAAAFAKPSNLLVLDEPTNDLDLETLDILENHLDSYAGTVLLVSHDRNFLDRIVTSIVTTAPNGQAGCWQEYFGGYHDMLLQRAGAPGSAVSDKKPVHKKAAREKNKEHQKQAPTKLSFKEKYALDQLPKKIQELEAAVLKAKADLSDPALFSTEPEKFEKIAAALARDEATLAAAEEEWLTLEMKRESLET